MPTFDRFQQISAEGQLNSLNPYAVAKGIAEQTPLQIDHLPSSPSWFPWLITGRRSPTLDSRFCC
jgi:hypothetical protein